MFVVLSNGVEVHIMFVFPFQKGQNRWGYIGNISVRRQKTLAREGTRKFRISRHRIRHQSILKDAIALLNIDKYYLILFLQNECLPTFIVLNVM